MLRLKYKIKFISDFEPGSGYGTELINDLVPVDSEGNYIIRGSHLKGVVREQTGVLWDGAPGLSCLPDKIFGSEYSDTDVYKDSLVHFSSAKASSSERKKILTRTAINDYGVGAEHSLRTKEAVPAGTEFEGFIVINSEDEILKRFIITVMLSISNLGGNRQRGGGECIITFEGMESVKPEELLPSREELRNVIDNLDQNRRISHLESEQEMEISEETEWIFLSFFSEEEICCPERPVYGQNTITGAYEIPASAVQGAVLTCINMENSKLATALFMKNNFRTFPLIPVDIDNQHKKYDSTIPLGVRVPVSFKVSKNKMDNLEYIFKDSVYEPFDWRTVPSNAALKGTSGVLQVEAESKKVSFIKNSMFPRIITTHCVHGIEPTLYTVESFAEGVVYSALLAVPASVRDEIIKILNGQFICFGKSRSISGGGILKAEPVDSGKYLELESEVYILQSPVLIDEDIKEKEAYSALKTMLAKEGWGDAEILNAEIGISFGWNRRYKNENIDGTGRQKAVRVIKSGSVFRLKEKRDCSKLLIRGLGKGKERGFGSVLPHPGIASESFEFSSSLPELCSNITGKLALELFNLSKSNSPSVSQIAALREKIHPLSNDCSKAKEYLEHIKLERPLRFWKPWKKVENKLVEIFNQYPDSAGDILKTWQDMANSN